MKGATLQTMYEGVTIEPIGHVRVSGVMNKSVYLCYLN